MTTTSTSMTISSLLATMNSQTLPNKINNPNKTHHILPPYPAIRFHKSSSTEKVTLGEPACHSWWLYKIGRQLQQLIRGSEKSTDAKLPRISFPQKTYSTTHIAPRQDTSQTQRITNRVKTKMEMLKVEALGNQLFPLEIRICL